MKNLLKQFGLILGLAVVMAGCSKKSDDNAKPKSSTWTVQGATYTSTTTVFTNNELLSIQQTNTASTEIGVQFSSRPAAGTYTIVDGVNKDAGSGTCSIAVTGGTAGATLVSTSGQVNVAVNGGKLSITFSNVNMGAITGANNNGQITFTSVGTASGILTEQ